MSNPPVQAQWSLSQTAGSAVTMTMGVLSALTSDNVQPIAYLACEKFGATLAISPDTLLKIEKSLVPSPPPASLAFLKAQVGFFSDDCVTQLGNSQAGVRFLALAAALKSTLELFQAASALKIMLTASTADPTLLPTTRHLKDLLSSLDARCHRVGFADDVLGWRVMLQKLLLPVVDFDFRSFPEERRVKDELLIMGPSPEMVDRLVDVFRQLARVGPSTVTGVTIRLCSAVPWVIAFTKWCLGVPPQISFDDPGGKVILSSHSPVTLRIPRCAREITHYKGLHITIHHEIDHPTMLLAGSGSVIWTGMVPMESYGQLLLQEHNFVGDDQRAVLHEALSCAIPLCLELLNFSNLFQQGESASYPPGRKSIDKRLFRYRLSPFHGIRKIAATYAKLFELPHPPDFNETTTTRRVGDCPLVKAWLEDLEARCPCYKCNDESLAPAKGSAPDCGPNYRGLPDHLTICGPCHCEGFYSSLGLIVAEILSLSLFDLSTGGGSSSPLLSVPSRMLPPDIERARLIEKVITSGRPARMDISDLLSISRAMVGHYGPTNPNTIMTSNKGQVLFPALFETPHLQRQGFMALSCVPGVLRYDGQEYRNASAQGFAGNLGQQFVADGVPPVLAPANLFPSLKTYWEITEGDDGLLGCNLGVRSESNPAYPVQVHAMDSLFGLQGCLLLDTCPHRAWETLEEPDRSSRYCKTLRADAGGDNSVHVKVVAIHDAEELLRLATISENYRSYGEGLYFVLRGNACLSCCLTLCRMAGVYRLIL